MMKKLRHALWGSSVEIVAVAIVFGPIVYGLHFVFGNFTEAAFIAFAWWGFGKAGLRVWRAGRKGWKDGERDT